MAKKLFDSAKAASKAAEKSSILPLKGPNSYAKWLSRIKTAQQNIETEVQPQIDRNVRRYLNKKREGQHDEALLVPVLYQRVEQKKSWLLPTTPQVKVTAKRPDAVAASPLVEAVMNDVLTAPQPDGVDAMVALEEVMSDMLICSGIFAVNIGYENITDGTKQIQTGVKPDPTWVPPAPDALIPGQLVPPPPMVPVYETVPNIVWEQYYMNRLESSKLLIPDDFTGSDYDRAPWLGFEFLIDPNIARLKWTIPDDYDSYVEDDERLADSRSREHSRADRTRKKFRCYCIFYKAAIFDDSVKNPLQQRVLILLDEHKTPLMHKNSPFQWEESDGTLGGMVGFPIHVGSLRVVPDSALPPADATMSEYQEEEISDGRTDMKLQRKRNIPLRVANITRLKAAGMSKIENAPYGAIIPLDDNAFGTEGQMPIKDVQTFPYPQENFTFDQINQRDLDATWGAGAGAGGSVPQGSVSTSATQAGAAQETAADRRKREQIKFMNWYARAAGKLLPLLQRFMTQTQYVQMLGPEDAHVLVEWNKDKIQGKFTLQVIPKASVADAELRQDELNWYNQVAKSPNINLRALDTELVKSFGKDPAKLINPPTPPPPPPPELPKGVSLSLDKMLASPNSPDFAIAIEILRVSGIPISNEAIAAAQRQAKTTGLPVTAVGDVVDGHVLAPPASQPAAGPLPQPVHPGAMPKADVVDKNFGDDNPGGLPGGTE